MIWPHPHMKSKYWFHAFAISQNPLLIRCGGTSQHISTVSPPPQCDQATAKEVKLCGVISALRGLSVTAPIQIGRLGTGWGISIKGVWTAGVSIKHAHHRRGCFLLVKVYRKSGDGAALSPAAPHHKSHFPVPRHKNLVSLISRPAIGDFELSTFISSLAK